MALAQKKLHGARGRQRETSEAWLTMLLPVRPTAASRARHALDGLKKRLDAETLDTLRLLVSEVVTNSIRHAGLTRGDTIAVTVSDAGEVMRVEVADAGAGFRPDRHPTPTPTGVGGWGLYLVDRLASRWGVSLDGATLVWFEVAKPKR